MSARMKFACGVLLGLVVTLSALADLRSTAFSGTFTGSGIFDSIILDSTNKDVNLVRDAANILALKNSTSPQTLRLYGSTTGPKYLLLQHSGSDGLIDTSASAGNLYLANGNAASVIIGAAARTTAIQFRALQQTAPTCSASCGTSPSVAGSDTAMIVTMGATGTPASPFTITFNGTWAAAPSCIVQSALSTMVVGKMPIAVQTATTTITVTTNGTAPGNSDKYAIHCVGVS